MFQLQANGWLPFGSDFDGIGNARGADTKWHFEGVSVPKEPNTGRRLVIKLFLANNLHATLKAHIELSNLMEQIRSFSNPRQTSSGFQIASIAKCSRKKVFLNATPLIAFENKAGCDADRDKNGKPSRSDVDGVSNAAMGEYEQTLRKKETEDDKIQHRSLAGGMRTDGGSTSLHFDVAERAGEEEQSKA
jgi:hypothetical protein